MRVNSLTSLALPTIVSGFHGVLPHARNKLYGLQAPTTLLPVSKQHENLEGNVIRDGFYNHATLSFSAIASTLLVSTSPAFAVSTSFTMATAGPVPSAFVAWAHYLGILGVSGALFAERFLLKKQMSVEDEVKMNMADGIYGLSAISLLISGYFRATDFAKGWDFYQHEPIFWLKMASVAILGALSFFPTIVLFRRDLARREGKVLDPLSDALVDRMTTIINAEILALFTIPLLASLMARGVLYIDEFPWFVGAGLYAVSLLGAGFKYGKEAFDMMESEGALIEVS